MKPTYADVLDMLAHLASASAERVAYNLGSPTEPVKRLLNEAVESGDALRFDGAIRLGGSRWTRYTHPRARHCRSCGCTYYDACDTGCHWVEEDLCSACDIGCDADGVEEGVWG